MWRKILVWAIKAAAASGLKDKAVEWLKDKLAKHVLKLQDKVNADLDAVEAAAGPVLLPAEPEE